MAEQPKDSFVIYPSMVAALEKLPPEARLEAYDALMRYGMTNIIPQGLSWPVEALITSFTTGIQGAKSRRKRAEQNGSKGGAPVGNQNAQKSGKEENNQKQPKTTENNLNVSVDVNVSADVDDSLSSNQPCSESGQTHPPNFKPPTFSEVQKYCLQRKNNIDAQVFIDYYEARGWFVDGRLMSSWRAIVRVWEKRQYPSEAKTISPPQGPAKNFIRHDYTPGELNKLFTDLDSVELHPKDDVS